MPRYAIVSDIHANLEAVTAVLHVIDGLHIDQILNLGDTVGYGANPNECLDLLRQRNVPSVAGNHDRAVAGLAPVDHFTETARAAIEWTRARLTPDHKSYLGNLPITCAPVDDFLLVHAALHPSPNDELRITSEHIAHKSFLTMRRSFSQARICFFGHTHRTVTFSHHHVTASAPLDSSATVRLRAEMLYLVNPGSVGQPRDHDLRAAFAIYDSDAQTIQFQRVEYDLLATKQKLARSGILPRHPLFSRLARAIGLR